MRILALIIGYGFGLFQTSYIFGKRRGFDIRKEGSGNAGTTNALRTMGRKAGALVMVCDILKCILAILLIWLLFGRSHPDLDYLLRVYAGLGAVLGHNFPFYMGFKGGKGVACTAGVIISISPLMTLIGIVLFFGTIAVTKYVSLGSLLVGVEFLLGTILLGQSGAFHMGQMHLLEMYLIVAVIVALMYVQHRGNIRRLLTHTERKTYLFRRKA